MEQASGPHRNSHPGHEAVAVGLNTANTHSKRLKDLENAALHTSLISQMETGSAADPGPVAADESRQGEQPIGLSFSDSGPLRQNPAPQTEEGEGETVKSVGEERTLTDHLNKRLLSSFLEKLNERDLALPGVQRLDCAVADEDSNRASDDW